MGLFNDAGEAFNQVTDTIRDGAEQGISDAQEAANQVRDGAEQLVSDGGDVFNQYTDTIEDASEFGEQLVSDGGEPVNYDDGPVVVDTSSQDNNLTDIQNMLLNPDEQVKKAVEQGQIELTDWEKDIFDAAAEVDDTSSQDDNLTDIQKRKQLILRYFPFIPEGLVETLAGDNQGLKDGGESVNQPTDTAKKTENNFLPEDIGKNLGLALYGILAVAGIAVFVYILSLLKPLFEIGSNVSEK